MGHRAAKEGGHFERGGAAALADLAEPGLLEHIQLEPLALQVFGEGVVRVGCVAEAE